MDFVHALLLSFVFETLLLLVISTIKIGPKIHESKVLDKVTLLLYALFLLVSINAIVIGQRHTSWFYLFALLNGFVTASCLITGKKSGSLNHFTMNYIISLPLIVISISLILNGFVPLSRDEGRFLGYAFRIIKDGWWVPFRYNENVYYQYFPVISFMEALISMVVSVDLLHGAHTIGVLYLTLIDSLLIWILAKRALMLNERSNSSMLYVLSIILFLCTPVVSPIAFIPRSLSACLYLLTLLLTTHPLNERRRACMVILVGLAGILTNAIYVILIIVSFGSITLVKILLKKGNLEVPSGIKTVTLMALTYWVQTIIIDQLTCIGKSFYDSLIDILTGRIVPSTEWRPMWYSRIPPEIATSWALLPASSSALLLLSAYKFKVRKDAVDPLYIGLGLAGCVILLLGFLSRMTRTPLHSYFYHAYFLLLLPSLIMLKEIASKRRVVNIFITALMISIISFYAIQDFTPDILKPTPVPNANSQIIATTISDKLTPRVLSQEQADIAIIMEYLVTEKMPELLYPSPTKFKEMIIVMRLDSHGKTWCTYQFGERVLYAIEEGMYPIIYDCTLAKAYYITLP